VSLRMRSRVIVFHHLSDAGCVGGEDRNRTYLGPAAAGSTTVLKTARATRHPSLSGLRIADCELRIEAETPDAQHSTSNGQPSELDVER
jgi:hypothetical protein